MYSQTRVLIVPNQQRSSNCVRRLSLHCCHHYIQLAAVCFLLLCFPPPPFVVRPSLSISSYQPPCCICSGVGNPSLLLPSSSPADLIHTVHSIISSICLFYSAPALCPPLPPSIPPAPCALTALSFDGGSSSKAVTMIDY